MIIKTFVNSYNLKYNNKKTYKMMKFIKIHNNHSNKMSSYLKMKIKFRNCKVYIYKTNKIYHKINNINIPFFSLIY